MDNLCDMTSNGEFESFILYRYFYKYYVLSMTLGLGLTELIVFIQHGRLKKEDVCTMVIDVFFCQCTCALKLNRVIRHRVVTIN